MTEIHASCLRFLFLFAFCLGMCNMGAHAATVKLDGGQQEVSLRSAWQVYEDKTAQLKIADITHPAHAPRFQPLQGNLSASFSSSVFWLKLDVQRSQLTQNKQWLLELSPVILDDIRLYHFAADGSMTTHRAGDRLPYSSREIRYRYPLFMLDLPDTEVHHLYLRIQSSSALFLQASLWEPYAFVEHANQVSNFMGIYYGIMLAMIIYNLLLAVTYRDVALRYYLLLSCVSLLAGMSLNGHVGLYLAPDWPELVDALPGILSPLVIMSTSMFIASFLRLHEKMPRIYRLFVLAQIICVCAALAVLAGYYQLVAPLMQLTGFALILVILPVCLIVGLRGYKPGYIVLLASATWITGLSLVTLRNLGVLEPGWATEYGFQIGSAVEAILLALAQAYHISLMKKEHAQTQAKLLEISQRTEQELDAKVRQRTTELADAVARLQKLDKDKNDFLGIAAHDLKNPLTSIIGMSDLLRKLQQSMPESQRQHYLERISNSGQRMMRIISNLLDVNALETGHLHLQMQSLDVSKILQDVAQQYTEMLKAKDLQVIMDIQDSVMVRADFDACVQIIDNLLSNAVKYSPLGKRIWLSVSNTPEFGVFQVRDEGPGLSAEDQQHLFEKFSKLSSLPTAGEHSSGLGLSIVKKLSEACGGKVHCESIVGEGCSFMVELPLAA
ncbi:MAG: sensor histidine kinase [Undibacterium umbellatum]|uniref:sensor histidine kinase n=1 Tax=Undibacterium umbellatum TaxID=2762300 RepID=UPI003BB74EE3